MANKYKKILKVIFYTILAAVIAVSFIFASVCYRQTLRDEARVNIDNAHVIADAINRAFFNVKNIASSKKPDIYPYIKLLKCDDLESIKAVRMPENYYIYDLATGVSGCSKGEKLFQWLAVLMIGNFAVIYGDVQTASILIPKYAYDNKTIWPIVKEAFDNPCKYISLSSTQVSCPSEDEHSSCLVGENPFSTIFIEIFSYDLKGDIDFESITTVYPQ